MYVSKGLLVERGILRIVDWVGRDFHKLGKRMKMRGVHCLPATGKLYIQVRKTNLVKISIVRTLSLQTDMIRFLIFDGSRDHKESYKQTHNTFEWKTRKIPQNWNKRLFEHRIFISLALAIHLLRDSFRLHISNRHYRGLYGQHIPV